MRYNVRWKSNDWKPRQSKKPLGVNISMCEKPLQGQYFALIKKTCSILSDILIIEISSSSPPPESAPEYWHSLLDIFIYYRFTVPS
jgi:hypothetical protein